MLLGQSTYKEKRHNSKPTQLLTYNDIQMDQKGNQQNKICAIVGFSDNTQVFNDLRWKMLLSKKQN